MTKRKTAFSTASKRSWTSCWASARMSGKMVFGRLLTTGLAGTARATCHRATLVTRVRRLPDGTQVPSVRASIGSIPVPSERMEWIPLHHVPERLVRRWLAGEAGGLRKQDQWVHGGNLVVADERGDRRSIAHPTVVHGSDMQRGRSRDPPDQRRSARTPTPHGHSFAWRDPALRGDRTKRVSLSLRTVGQGRAPDSQPLHANRYARPRNNVSGSCR